MDKLIITAALTCAEVTRTQQPHLPITPVEIGIAAAECAAAGASIVHVHGRLAAPTFSIDEPIGRDPASRIRMAVVRGGRPSRTDVERLAEHPDGDGQRQPDGTQPGDAQTPDGITGHQQQKCRPIYGSLVTGVQDKLRIC